MRSNSLLDFCEMTLRYSRSPSGHESWTRKWQGDCRKRKRLGNLCFIVENIGCYCKASYYMSGRSLLEFLFFVGWRLWLFSDYLVGVYGLIVSEFFYTWNSKSKPAFAPFTYHSSQFFWTTHLVSMAASTTYQTKPFRLRRPRPPPSW